MQGGVQAGNTDFLCSDLDILGTSMLSPVQQNRWGVAAHLFDLAVGRTRLFRDPCLQLGSSAGGGVEGSPLCMMVSSAPLLRA